MNEIIVTRNNTEVFRHGITVINYTERLSVQLEGGWMNIPLERGVLYNVRIHSEGAEDVMVTALYEGYWYNAMVSGTDSGLMVTNNSIQFNVVF